MSASPRKHLKRARTTGSQRRASNVGQKNRRILRAPYETGCSRYTDPPSPNKQLQCEDLLHPRPQAASGFLLVLPMCTSLWNFPCTSTALLAIFETCFSRSQRTSNFQCLEPKHASTLTSDSVHTSEALSILAQASCVPGAERRPRTSNSRAFSCSPHRHPRNSAMKAKPCSWMFLSHSQNNHIRPVSRRCCTGSRAR